MFNFFLTLNLTTFFPMSSKPPEREVFILFKPFSLMLVPDRGSVRSLRMTPRLLAILSGSLVSLLVIGAWGGWQVWHGQAKNHQIMSLKNQLAMAQARHQGQIGKLQTRIDSDRKQLAVYARNIGTMQARLARLDALGSQLVEVASLDASEFNFGLQPAIGGPRMQVRAVNPSGIDASLERLDSRLLNIDTQLAAIDYLLETKRTQQAAKPHAWPTEGGWISSRYGMRIDPFNGGREMHRGLDIANRFGAPVLAASHGIVTFAGKMKGFGNMIDIDHGYGYVSRYGHMSSLTVHVGDEVADDQLIGRVGSKGRSTGPHLHYEVHRYGRSLDPLKYLPRG